ncbi:protein CASC1-like [Folsomia candida]|nr:protein CASC1-like [Folsomia candida]
MCFSLIAAIAVIEFIVMGDLICISSLSNVANSSEVEASLINKYMKPHILIKAMRHHGLDLFPEFDSYAYVDGVLVKDVAAEDHLYQCMAVVSSAFNFQWSRWNLLAGRDRMVYQMRQRLHGSASPGNYSMVLTTPTKSIRIDCTEVSPNYTEDPVMEFEYYADLVNLVKGIATDAGIKIINQSSPHYVETVRILLSSVRPLSFS